MSTLIFGATRFTAIMATSPSLSAGYTGTSPGMGGDRTRIFVGGHSAGARLAQGYFVSIIPTISLSPWRGLSLIRVWRGNSKWTATILKKEYAETKAC